MYYKETDVINFGKFAKVKVKWIRLINDKPVYTYDLSKLENIRFVIDSYMKSMVSEGWQTNFIYPCTNLCKDNRKLFVEYFPTTKEIILKIGGE